eukprot:g3169.t1
MASIDRFTAHGLAFSHDAPSSDYVASLLAKYDVSGSSVALLGDPRASSPGTVVTTVAAGVSDHLSRQPLTEETWLEHCSLSKTVGTAFALEYFWVGRGVSPDTPVNVLLAEAGSPFRLRAAPGKPAEWAGQVTLRHLCDHTGLGMHYVNGIRPSRAGGMPPVLQLIEGRHEAEFGYPRADVHKAPGKHFGYSGGGFLVLQHLIETFEGGKPIQEVMAPFLARCGMAGEFSFEQDHRKIQIRRPNAEGRGAGGGAFAAGYRDDGSMVEDGRLMFPPLAAGGLGTARSLAAFLWHLAEAYRRGPPPATASAAAPGPPISHTVARYMLDSVADRDGSMAFMGAAMGVGVFIAEAGPNRIMCHQAANDGFRGVYMVCFDGPAAAEHGPKGFVLLANGDNKAVPFQSELSRALLDRLQIGGIDWKRVEGRAFRADGIKQEEIVNFGLKALVLDAFVPRAPDDPEQPAGGTAGAPRARL